MKTCNSCSTEKEPREFHKRAASRDGLSAKCRSCQSIYDKQRSQDPKRVAARAEYAKTERGKVISNRAKKAWAQRNAGRVAEMTRAYRQAFPVKKRCHGLAAYAVSRKKIARKPCEVCGKSERVHAHHDDYAKPLEVRWLCPAHHRQWHVENGEAKNAA